MDQGRIIVNITKQLVGPAFNSQWSVLIDGRFAGNADFKKNLLLSIPNGKHVVQLKVGLQETKILEVEVNDNDVIVECAYDGTVNNFYVVGQNNPTCTEPALDTTNSTPSSSSENVAPTTNSTKKKANIWVIIACIFLGLGIIGALGDNSGNINENNGSNSYPVSDEVLEAAEKKAKSMVSYEISEIPNVSAENIYCDGEFAIIKVSYKTNSGYQGTYFYYVATRTAIVWDGRYMHSATYDYDLSPEELELTKAEWEMD